MLKIASVQIGSACWDTAKNVDKRVKWLREAAKNGAKIGIAGSCAEIDAQMLTDPL